MKAPSVLAAVIMAAILGCASPGPTPAPVTPGPAAPFVCDGAASVPSFNALVNDLLNAAELVDDAEANAGIDAVAKAAGVPQVMCTIGVIMPDLRGAPQTQLHLEVWQAQHNGAAWLRRHSPPGAVVWSCVTESVGWQVAGGVVLVCQDNTGGIL